jgi:hypothetical protein
MHGGPQWRFDGFDRCRQSCFLAESTLAHEAFGYLCPEGELLVMSEWR